MKMAKCDQKGTVEKKKFSLSVIDSCYYYYNMPQSSTLFVQHRLKTVYALAQPPYTHSLVKTSLHANKCGCRVATKSRSSYQNLCTTLVIYSYIHMYS